MDNKRFCLSGKSLQMDTEIQVFTILLRNQTNLTEENKSSSH